MAPVRSLAGERVDVSSDAPRTACRPLAGANSMIAAHSPACAADGLIACHECDALHRLTPLAAGERAHCTRCGGLLYREPPGGVDRPLALALAALGLFAMANLLPFIALKLEGRVEQNLAVSGAMALWREGMPELGVLVFSTSVAFPVLTLGALLWILVPLRAGRTPRGAVVAVRVLQALSPWTLLAVFMLGVLIAFVKLLDLATVIPGPGMVFFGLLIVVMTAAWSSFDTSLVWPRAGPRITGVPAQASAHQHGLAGCHVCGLLFAASRDPQSAGCPRCGTRSHGPRKPDSIARTWALVVSSALLVIPANVYPVMTVIRFGRGEPSTILAGVVHLIEGGMWGLAMIVFFASVVVPGLKLALLTYLLVSVHRRSRWRPRDRTRLYRVTEVVGAWSMVDVFLVGILTALVNLGALATIRPGIGATFFAAVVVITMFAARSFDPRLIWDHRGGAR